MLKTLKVKPEIYPKAYSSFSSAVKNTSIPELKLINGQALLDYQFDGRRLFFILNNGVLVIISIGDNVIDFKSNQISFFEKLNPPEAMMFEFTSGEIFRWDSKACFDNIVGKKIAFYPNDQFLFLSCEDGREYMFNAVASVSDERKKFLYLSEV
ncbi:hypothetical protein OOT55_07860 [Marinimicrobium sp. C6131]|uniref:hypothetical protein n=1 Tax=Marinimicrobium sp. C6131 TaxID=3022676 RepID=UPI00223DFC98|nr:hypothetical protein [Marinimicrobium sp. C6131]UZJ45952.1 hypothetical protein OOT55_07860 [Marinimicrobium sp. C6131]